MSNPQVIAVLCSDVHLSHHAPVARSAEPNWYDAMLRPLHQLRDLSIKFSCPLVIAGDIFDKWNSPPQLVNFALDWLKEVERVYAIPGQHDLPGHNYEESHRSAYETLIKANAVIPLSPDEPTFVLDKAICLHSFPWGFPVVPLESDLKRKYNSGGNWIHLAVVHAYIWKAGFSYPGADESKLVAVVKDSLDGYDAAVFGDNHMGFQAGKILNSGGLMRRKIDEINYKPSVGLLKSDGSIERHFLDTSKDIFVENQEYLSIPKEELDFDEYIEELKEMGLTTLDFKQEIKRRMDETQSSKPVRRIILDILE